MRIDLGGGLRPRAGCINLDMSFGQGLFRRDALMLPWPIGDGECDLVNACHMLEHIPSGVPRIKVFNEVHRVLRVGGVFDIRVPKFPHPSAVADPTHVSLFVRDSFVYFTNTAESGIFFWRWDMESIVETDAEIHCLLVKP